MAKTKKRSKKKETSADVDLLKSDVASFASSIGLSSSLPSSGFNDSDFRKRGSINEPHNQKTPKTSHKANQKKLEKTHKEKQIDNKLKGFDNVKKKNAQNEKLTPKAPVLSLLDKKVKAYDKFKNLPKLPLMKASALAVWYADAAELEEKVLGEGKKLEIRDLEKWKEFVEKKRELGDRLMAQYALDYESSRGQTGDVKMLVATQRSGTAADKVSAFSVLVGDNPIANLRSLDALLGMVTSKVGKRHALTGFEALKELFISSLLPDRKLKSLIQRPLDHLPETKDGYSILLFWYWEDCLKQRYERFVVALEEASRDMLPILKDKALKIMYTLLKSKSEQERRLLAALVNKLGDPQNRCASNADFHLTNLLSEHPNMKAVVINEVDSFLFRPHLGLRSKYHAVNFLSQIRLSHKGDGPKVARRLIEVYFALFKVLISEAGGGSEMDKTTKIKDKKASDSIEDVKKNTLASHVEMDSRLLSALLTGVNRAFPYVSSNEADDIIEVQTPMLFKLVHSKNFNVGVQALMLLDKISSKNQIVSDRFYRALYSKLLLPAAMNTSKAEMFFGLLLRAMKSDVNLKRVCAFAKRLLQVALQQPAQYACGCLFLLSEVLKARPPLWNIVLQNESGDDELEHFNDITEETDKEQGTELGEQEDRVNNVINGDVVNHVDNSSKDEGEVESEGEGEGEDEDEDEDDDEASASYSEDNEGSDEVENLLRGDAAKYNQEFKTLSNCDVPGPPISLTGGSIPGGYDPRHREPSYSNADRVSWWELAVLASHVHPSVATMARTLLSGANIVYNGNPLNDLSLGAFLDKFKEKKPKPSSWHGGSQIEPAKKLDMNHHIIGPEILSLAEVDVPPEDLVFHKFYVNKMNSSKKPKKKKKKSTEDEAAVELFDVDGVESDDEVEGGDESDNEEIENMLDASLEADGEYGYDDLEQVADDEDEDLIASDGEPSIDFGIDDGQDFDINADDDDDDDDVEIDVGDADDGADIEDASTQRKRKRKSGVSPFASLEDYEHLLNDDSPAKKSSRKTKHKSQSNSDVGAPEKDSMQNKRKYGKKKRSSK